MSRGVLMCFEPPKSVLKCMKAPRSVLSCLEASGTGPKPVYISDRTAFANLRIPSSSWSSAA